MSGELKMAAVVLAAGASTRMGRPKALLEYQGETLLDGQIGLYAGGGRRVVCVLGYGAEGVAAGLRRAGEAVLVLNPRPERGQLSSLQCGLRAVGECEAVYFLPVDAPAVSPETLRLMEEAWRRSRAAFVIPRCGGKRGHPVLMRGGLVGEMLALGEGATARDLVHARRAETVYVDVEDRRVGMDLDTPGDFEALQREELP